MIRSTLTSILSVLTFLKYFSVTHSGSAVLNKVWRKGLACLFKSSSTVHVSRETYTSLRNNKDFFVMFSVNSCFLFKKTVHFL